MFLKRPLVIPFFLLAISLFSQSQQIAKDTKTSSCPIQFTRLNSHSIDMTKPYSNHAFFIEWKNVSDKTIVGVKFEAIFYNSVGDKHQGYEPFINSDKVKPGKKPSHNDYDDDSDLRASSWGRAQVYPVRIRFEDGSAWDNPGQECISPIK